MVSGHPHVQEWSWTTVSHHTTRVNSKWTKVLDVRPKTIKLLGKKQIVSPLTSVLVMIFWVLLQNEKETKAKINKCDYIKLKRCCTTKKAINKKKRQPTEWEKKKMCKSCIWEEINIQNTYNSIAKHLNNPIKK